MARLAAALDLTLTISATATAAVSAQNTAEQPVTLITVDSPEWAAPFRVCDDYNPITSRGDLFDPFPFEIELPDSKSDQLPRAKLVVANVTRELTDQIIELTDSPTLKVEIVLKSEPDTVIYSTEGLALENPRWTADTIAMDLTMRDITREPFAKDRTTPALFPALFGG